MRDFFRGWRRKAGVVTLWILVLAIALAAFFLWISFRQFLHERRPYQMMLQSVDGQTVVQFAWVDRLHDLVSPEFPVNISAGSPHTVSLLSADSVQIPGCRVEFFDRTILPGRFTLRIGDTVYDVMERAIIVDGKEFDWQQRQNRSGAPPP